MSLFETRIGTDLAEAAGFLRQQELVAVPTETVYGLAANAFSADAVLKIFGVKNRPRFNPLIVHTSSFTNALAFVQEIPPEAVRLAEAFWPGALTLLLPRNNKIPDLVTAGSHRVAIRVPAHLLTLELLQQLEFPVAAPSANPSGYISPTTAQHVWQGLHGKIPYILDGGPCVVGVESTILGWDENGAAELYRPGGIATEAIEEVLGKKVRTRKGMHDQPEAPGQLKSHYAPHTPLYLGSLPELLQQFRQQQVTVINFREYRPELPEEQQLLLAPSGTLEEAAKNLFRILREADQRKANAVLAELLPQVGLGRAINDRLQRAQHRMKSS
ncbi:MAG TPA: L-threonylcarbamoyladenylate synthase [Lacibacter sp.]|nr:L-threonylcarbamoyladenylate synthase [Lacibacter sp.]HMO89685.1 L-threonylcarbamoyladenylate synthase [Lacibacter sp.]HMP87638.1 L-threonylcarbamoyladenylate synthase [Lacibacter sp.]